MEMDFAQSALCEGDWGDVLSAKVMAGPLSSEDCVTFDTDLRRCQYGGETCAERRFEVPSAPMLEVSLSEGGLVSLL